MISNIIFQNTCVQLDLAVIPAPERTSHKDHKFKVGVSSTCQPCGVWISANPRASRVTVHVRQEENPVLSDLAGAVSKV